MKQQLSDQCDKLIQWGKLYTYHWFWGITKIKPLAPNPTSINELADRYDDRNAIDAFRLAVMKNYRSRNPISRFFIWIFNYNDLVKKNIALTYIDIRSYANEVKEKNMTTDERSPVLNKAIFQKLVEAGSTLGKQASSLGSAVKSMCIGITTFIKSHFLNEEQPPIESNASDVSFQREDDQDDEAQRIVCRNSKMQEALKNFGIICRVGETYSEKALKRQWLFLAKQYHPDQGGSAEKFRTLKEAKVLLDKFAKEALDKSNLSSSSTGGTYDIHAEIEASNRRTKAYLAKIKLAYAQYDEVYRKAEERFKQFEINAKQREEEDKQRKEAEKQLREQWAEAEKLQAEKAKRDQEEIQMMNEELATMGLGPLAPQLNQDYNNDIIEELNEEKKPSSPTQSRSASVTSVSMFQVNSKLSTSVTEASELVTNSIGAEIQEARRYSI